MLDFILKSFSLKIKRISSYFFKARFRFGSVAAWGGAGYVGLFWLLWYRKQRWVNRICFEMAFISRLWSRNLIYFISFIYSISNTQLENINSGEFWGPIFVYSSKFGSYPSARKFWRKHKDGGEPRLLQAPQWVRPPVSPVGPACRVASRHPPGPESSPTLCPEEPPGPSTAGMRGYVRARGRRSNVASIVLLSIYWYSELLLVLSTYILARCGLPTTASIVHCG